MDLIFYSPLSGPVVPLEEVPDPVFAQRMAGDGLAIDPLDHRVLSPCSAKVIQVHRKRHVVALATDEGVKILIHVGIETVSLDGEGFQVRVSEGQRVSKGDLLIEFDADLIACKAKSLITVVLITNSDRFRPTNQFQGLAEASTTPLFLIHTKVGKTATTPEVRVLVKEAFAASLAKLPKLGRALMLPIAGINEGGSHFILILLVGQKVSIRKASHKDEGTASFGLARTPLERLECGSCTRAVCGKVGFLACEAAS
jgi:multiphosphoryl transfer protein